MIRGSLWAVLAVAVTACTVDAYPRREAVDDSQAGASGGEQTQQTEPVVTAEGGDAGSLSDPDPEPVASGGEAPASGGAGASGGVGGEAGKTSGGTGGRAGAGGRSGAASGGKSGGAGGAPWTSAGASHQAGAAGSAGAPPACECSTGACCDGCHARPNWYSCGTYLLHTASCVHPTPGSGYQISKAIMRQYGDLFCDGESTGECSRWIDTIYVGDNCPEDNWCLSPIGKQPYCGPL